MSRARYVAYRLAWGVVSTLCVTLALFVVGRSIGDLRKSEAVSSALPNVSNDLWNASDPLLVQYADWLSALVTLEWGTSIRFGEPVVGLLAERAALTAAYLVPAVLFGTAASVALGYVAARRRGRLSDRAIRGAAYLVLAVPNFFVGATVVRYVNRRAYEIDASTFEYGAGLLTEWNAIWLAAATTLLGTHVCATQLQQVRAQSGDQLETDLARLVRAKGAGPLRTARHVLRATAASLAALFVAETVGLLLVSVFVIEAVLSIPGIGYVTWQAASVNDVPVVLAATVLVSLSIVAASVVEDLAALVLDPRIAD